MSYPSNYHRSGLASTLGNLFSFGSGSRSQSVSSRWAGTSFVRGSRERRSYTGSTRAPSRAFDSGTGPSYSVQTGYTSPTSPQSVSRTYGADTSRIYGADTSRARLLVRTSSAPSLRAHSRRSSGEYASSHRQEKPLDFVHIETKLNGHVFVDGEQEKVDMDEVFGNKIPISPPTLSPVFLSPKAETRHSQVSPDVLLSPRTLSPRALSPAPRALSPVSPRALSPVSPRALSPVSSRALSPVQSSMTSISARNVEVDVNAHIRRTEQLERDLDLYKSRYEKESGIRKDLENQLSEAREEITALSGINRRLKGDNEALRKRCQTDEIHCSTGLMDMRSHYEKVVRNTKKDLEAYYMERVRRVTDEAKRHAVELGRVTADWRELSEQIRSLQTENDRLRRMAGFESSSSPSTTKTTSGVAKSPTKTVTFKNGPLPESTSNARTTMVRVKYVDAASTSSSSDEDDTETTSVRAKSKISSNVKISKTSDV
ncbi:keratin, type II cytoskeletal 78-like [Branchiostoma lanceolatum]|uniref:keratin, type II cytoskeletal 78-like n=1 Tax=Branchiostoma lanceolatum TaxID=7740 RepID=UPI003451BD13